MQLFGKLHMSCMDYMHARKIYSIQENFFLIICGCGKIALKSVDTSEDSNKTVSRCI